MDEEFLPIDLIFAKELAPQGSAATLNLLATLLRGARKGKLYLDVESAQIEKELPKSLFEKFLVFEESRLYLRRNWECEKKFRKHLHRLLAADPEKKIEHEALYNCLRPKSLETEQKEAILRVVTQSVTLICGGPGTGKSHVVRTLVEVLANHLREIQIAAPTGKAAANLRRAFGITSEKHKIQTLHTLLTKRYLSADLVIVDEASMIAGQAMADLFAGIKSGARIVLVGDPDQLPPIEPGNFFAEMAKKMESVIWLRKCLRTDSKEILDLAARVRIGAPIPFTPLPSVKKVIEEFCKQRVLLLTPLRKGPYGVENLNTHLARTVAQNEVPILISVNDSHLDLYNGDIGILKRDERKAYFGEKKIAEALLPPFELAFALTVHKSQGSEYDEVVILIPPGSEQFGKKMLYTAVTRARKKVQIFAEPETLNAILAN